MKIIAAMDIKDGRCVQLTQGKFKSKKKYSTRPIEIIKSWESTIIDKIQIVDLDGVISGKTQMYSLLDEIRKSTNFPIQFGGGIRNYETAKKILDSGIDEIILGTSAIKDQELLIRLLEEYGNRIIVAVDIYKGFVYVEGWAENSSISLSEFINTLELLNVNTIIITDISKDGTLDGANLKLLDDLLLISSLSIILSGGINSNEDIDKLKKRPLEGIVLDTVIYESVIKL